MKTILKKTLADGRVAEVSFDGRSLYAATISGKPAGSGHGIAWIAARGFYAVGSVALTCEEHAVAAAAANAMRDMTPDKSQARVNAVSEAIRSGDINKFGTI